MNNPQPDGTDKTPRHLHYVLRVGNPGPGTPMLDPVERWNWAVRISVVGLFVLALVVIVFEMKSVVVPADGKIMWSRLGRFTSSVILLGVPELGAP
jgi:hypothetical protein